MNHLGWIVLFAFVSCSHVERPVNEFEDQDLETLIEFADTQDLKVTKTKGALK